MKCCGTCKEEFTRQSSLSRHIAVAHTTPSERQTHRCETCGKTFARKDILVRHVTEHTGGNSEACRLCLRTFRKDYLRKHLLRCEKKPKPFRETIWATKRAHDDNINNAVPCENHNHRFSAAANSTNAGKRSPTYLRWQESNSELAVSSNLSGLHKERKVETGSSPRPVTRPPTFGNEATHEYTLEKGSVAQDAVRSIKRNDLAALKLNFVEASRFGLSAKQLDSYVVDLDGYRTTLLMHAASCCGDDTADIMRFLPSQDLDVNYLTEDPENRDWTALHWACRWCNSFAVQLLLEHGARVDGRYMPPLLMMCFEEYLSSSVRGRQFDVTEMLLKAGANLHDQDDKGNTSLHCAAEIGHNQILALLLKHGCPVDPINAEGVTPLRYAIDFGWFRIAKVLLAHGASANGSTTGRSPRPLPVACQNGDVAMVGLLLQANADVHTQAPLLLETLVADCNWFIAGMLFKAGVSTSDLAQGMKNQLEDNLPPLSWSARFSDALQASQAIDGDRRTDAEELLARVMRWGYRTEWEIDATIELWSSLRDLDTYCGLRWGWCLMGFVVAYLVGSSCYLRNLRYLLSKDLSMDAMGTNGWTALHLAAHRGELEAIELLLDAGADANVRTFSLETGRLPVELARKAGHQEVVELLTKHCQRGDVVNML